MSSINLDTLEEMIERSLFGEGVPTWALSTPEMMAFVMMGCKNLDYFEGHVLHLAADCVARLCDSMFSFVNAHPTMTDDLGVEGVKVHLRILLRMFKVLHRNGLRDELRKMTLDQEDATLDDVELSLRDKMSRYEPGRWDEVPSKEGSLLSTAFEQAFAHLISQQISPAQAVILLSTCVHLVETSHTT